MSNKPRIQPVVNTGESKTPEAQQADTTETGTQPGAAVVDTKPPEAQQEAKPKPPAKAIVILPDKIVAYGGQFYDPVAKVWIKGTKDKPQEVKLTLFVRQKIGNGELIEIRE